jgi:hypothetical protein
VPNPDGSEIENPRHKSTGTSLPLNLKDWQTEAEIMLGGSGFRRAATKTDEAPCTMPLQHLQVCGSFVGAFTGKRTQQYRYTLCAVADCRSASNDAYPHVPTSEAARMIMNLPMAIALSTTDLGTRAGVLPGKLLR